MRTYNLVGAAASWMPDAPANPSFQQAVMPVLAANCLRCHPEDVRLDSFAVRAPTASR